MAGEFAAAVRVYRGRRSVRLRGYDYASSGQYFITICTQHRICRFAQIDHGVLLLNDLGQMIQNQWLGLAQRFPNIQLEQYVVMPNHLHGIIRCRGEPCVRPISDYGVVGGSGGRHGQGEHKVRPYGTSVGSIGRIVQAFKSITTHDYIVGVKKGGWSEFDGKLWQRNYWDHIIRNEDEYDRIAKYILENPACWIADTLHPDAPSLF